MTLDRDQIERLIRAAVEAGLYGREKRPLLLAGYSAAWQAALPEHLKPDDQIRRDLFGLNAQAIDGRPGLAIWLSNARGMSDHPGIVEALEALGLPVPAAGAASAPAKPEAPHFVSTHRMPTGTGDFVGRDDELADLDAAYADPSVRVRSLVAWGGVGKSALVREWLDGVQGPRIYVWSFYDQGAGDDRQTSSDLFFQKALAKFGDPDPTAGDIWDRAERLAELVNQAPTVLVLDGVEPLQHPPGPMGGQLKDPGLKALLHELADRMNGLCLVTTRQCLTDLADRRGGFRETQLAHLGETAGIALLRAKGVLGEDAELAAAVQAFAGHALALTLLGNLLRVYADGDVRRRDTIPALTEDERAGGHARRVMLAHEERLGAADLAVLRMLGLFDRPAEPEVLAVLREPPIEGLSDAIGTDDRAWRKALDHLKTLGLVAVRGDALDVHPLVRGHFADQVRETAPEAWTAAHERLYRHFAAAAPDQPDTLEAMEPLFRAVTHGCAAGRYQEVFVEVYWRRIRRGDEGYTTKKLGAFAADLAALAGFFATPWAQPQRALTSAYQAVALNFAGFRLRAIGRLAEAVAPMQAGLAIQARQEDWKNAAIAAGNLSEVLLTTGQVAAAEARAAEAVAHADRSGDWFQRMGKRTTHADALHQRGALDAAADLFAQAEALQSEQQPDYPLFYSLQGYQYGDLWLSRGQPAEARRRAERTLPWVQGQGWLLDIALDHLLLGRAALAQGEHPLAAEHLDHAVRGLRRAGQQEFIARGLLARAALHRALADHPAAARDLTEARRIVERGGMRLFLADVHLESARLHLAQGDRDAARADLLIARDLVNEMGYHRRDPELAALAAELDPRGDPA